MLAFQRNEMRVEVNCKDGVIAGLTYPDTITYLSFAQDCRLLAHYFADAADGGTFEQQTAVIGTSTWRL